MTEQTPIQLRWLANECDQLATQTSGDAGKLLAIVSRHARQTAMAPNLTPDQRRDYLNRLRALTSCARWFAGLDETNHNAPAIAAPAITPAPAGLLGSSELAKAFGLSDRHVRRVIGEAMAKGLPGFYRDGWRWQADPVAFASRMSELCPSAWRAVSCDRDEAHNRPTP